MDRRDFVKALVASGVLGAASGTTRARPGHTVRGGGTSVTLVVERGVPWANELADGIGMVLADAGIGLATQDCAARPTHAEATVLLDRPAGTWLIGVTRDAAAEICQAVTATRGSICVLRGQHRIGRHDVHHCCTSPAVDEVLRWSELRSVAGGATGRLYAQVLGIPLTCTAGHAKSPRVRGASPTATIHLASFLIRV